MRLNKLFLGLALLLELLISCAGFGQQPLLQITSPADGAVVKSNQTITVTVSADSSLQNLMVFTDYRLGVGSGSTPNQFLLTLPATIEPRIYQLTAVGVDSSGNLVKSDPVNIDIEPQYEANQVSAEPDTLDFEAIGDQLPITAFGTFPDGNTLDTTYSSKTAYISNNPNVVTVSSEGIATAVAPGTTYILVKAIGYIQSSYYPIEVKVPQPVISDVSPASGSVGAIVTISGAGFGPTQGVCVVTFSGISAAPTYCESSSIVVAVPGGLPLGNANVVVTVNGFSSNAGNYTVTSTEPTADFSISASPYSRSFIAGGSTSYTVSTSARSGFSGAVSLGAIDLPAGVTASFNPASISGADTSMLTLSAAASAPAGKFTIGVTGASAGLTRNTSINIILNPPPDFSVSATPASQTTLIGGSANYNISTTGLSGFNGTELLSVSGLPTGATASFSPSSLSGSGYSTLNVSISNSTPAGNTTLTITGTSGSITHTASTTLGIQDFSLAASPASQTVGAGTNTSYTVTLTPTNGFTDTISLDISGLPAGATASFSPAPITGGSGTSILSVSTTSSTPVGSYSLVITGTDGNGNFTRSTTVALTVYSGPALNVSTASLNWGNVTAYGSLVFQVVRLTAVNGAVTINSTTINTATAGDFRISSNNCPSSSASLASGTSCSIVLYFYPQVPAVKSGTLVISDNTGAVSHSVALAGVGIGFNPYSLYFNNQTTGTSSATQTVTLMNPGSTPLSIASIKLTAGINYPSSTISHDFQQTNNCPTPIPAGGSCVFTITFTPTTTGRIDAYLVVDLGVSNGASRSWLEGYGVGFTPSSLTFPSQTVGTTSASQTIALGGVGSTIFVSSITVSGDFQQSSCGAFPIRIDPYQTCTITVTFTPTVIGTQANMLTATDSYGVQGGPQRATLTGTGQ